MTDQLEVIAQESEPLESSAAVWKVIACCLLTFLLGAGIPLFVTRDSITKVDMAAYLSPIQKQLDDLSAEDGEHRRAIEQLDVDVARIAQQLNISARPIP